MCHPKHDEGAFATAAGSQIPVTLVTDNLEKSSLDDRVYRVVRLDNELEALLVHDPKTDKASAALDVNVGNFSDESDVPGMAHAVEHLLFMGTKKFPTENEYGQYILDNSGSYNAYTYPTSTNYHFDISAKSDKDQEPSDTNPSPLRGALDRFAQFFIEPLFLYETLDRELNAVNSEHKNNLQDDDWRLEQLEKSLSNPEHPFHLFGTGNYEVLKTLPEARGINVRDKFIEFHDKHYSANRMKLVVLGRESLDVLQKWVAELFSPIVNKKLPPNRWPGELPFRESDLGMQCFAKPVKDLRELNLYFPFIDEEFMFATQPSRYISHLLGHERPGSIMSYLKSKGWADGLYAGAHPVCPGTPDIFNVQVCLTEEGLKNYDEIIMVFFQYLTLLREEPPQEWRFQEQKVMANVAFKYEQKTPASSFARRISSVMQKPLPREWLLSGHTRLREFAPDQIEQALSKIRPDNFRMVIVSRNHPGNWDQKEKWYGTEYRHEKIPNDLMEEIKKAAAVSPKERLPALYLPKKNEFIPNDLDLEVKKEVDEPALNPQVLRNDDIARTWWKKDNTFCVPLTYVGVSLRTRLIYTSAENTVRADLFIALVNDSLRERSQYARLAGFDYSLSRDERGLLLLVEGYSEKLPTLLEQVVTTMRDLRTGHRFEIVKERRIRAYENWQLGNPYTQVSDYIQWLNAPDGYFTIEELTHQFQGSTIENVGLFANQMLSQMFIEVYVYGNTYKKDAPSITNMIESILKPRALPRDQWPVMKSLLLTEGSNYVFRKTLKDEANVNHCVETWFYAGSRDDREICAKTMLLGEMLHVLVFDQLRTKEQLGYILFSGPGAFSTTYGFYFLIQSEMTPEFLDARIEAFLMRYAHTLEKMTENEFEGHKRSLINKKLEKVINFDQEWVRHWSQITNERYDFELAQRDAAQIKLLTKLEVVEFYSRLLNPTSTRRARLSIHLKAQNKAEGVDKRQEEAQRKADEEPSPGNALETAQEITDVGLYKAGLAVSSGLVPFQDIDKLPVRDGDD
ncbi:uncharacterized protein FIESC28_11410 [Fusarium coffeatum]|uniref:Insulysin n=1 Tax=Fusarium coffeatum TaxID=231269 RepID=A0A366QMT2_9HYPO|nr:uncharacterized protein FIESC28_11410 [Fusarium coffeatum]RBR05200.1 hypothetical protein FIESC28_11410 [Fusarium coffeatum]